MTTREAVTSELEDAIVGALNLSAVGDSDASQSVRSLAKAILILLNRVEQLAGDDK